jgi:hypothetical protein
VHRCKIQTERDDEERTIRAVQVTTDHRADNLVTLAEQLAMRDDCVSRRERDRHVHDYPGVRLPVAGSVDNLLAPILKKRA